MIPKTAYFLQPFCFEFKIQKTLLLTDVSKDMLIYSEPILPITHDDTSVILMI